MENRVILHVGSHKTGTTSIQRFLYDINESGLLGTINSEYPKGYLSPRAHHELVHYAMRSERRLATHLFPCVNEPDWDSVLQNHIYSQLMRAKDRDLVYSAEGLFHIRYEDEFEKIRSLFEGRKIEVIIFFREPSAYLKAYADTLSLMGVQTASDPESIAYVQSDTWLVDYPARLASWQKFAGVGNVSVFNYDETNVKDGSVIPAFASRLGLKMETLPNLAGYFYNQRRNW